MEGLVKSITLLATAVMFVEQGFGKSVVSLQKALDKKMITAKATCSGGLHLDYRIKNTLKDSLYIMVPAGWRFNSDDKQTDYQDILVTRDTVFRMKAKEDKVFAISGYCCEATKSGPIKGIAYTLGKMADSSLTKLAVFLNSQRFDKNMEQYSVWAISNNKPTASISCQNDSVATILRSFVSTLKGEPLPWYTLVKRAGVSTAGTVTDHPIKFKATVNYQTKQPQYSYCYIVDVKGNKVSEIQGKWLLSDGATYPVTISIAHLKQGDYKLVLETNQEKLVEREFKI